jgi:hypothetical protein
MSMLRMAALFFALVLLALVSPAARAQGDKIEVFGGYSYMRSEVSPSYNTNGWELSGQYKFGFLGAVADIDGHYGSPYGVSSSLHTYLFGPQVSWPGRVSPFAHLLIGGAHINTGGVTDNSFAVAIGGGIDTRLMANVYWRVIQGDVVHTSLLGSGQSNPRLSTGIVIHF